MTMRHSRWLLKKLAIAVAIAAGVSALAVPVRAQFFDNRFPSNRPSGRQTQRPDGFFSFPFFDRPQYNQPYGAPSSPAAPVDSSKAPSPRKLETQPSNTVVVIGDSLADWLSYGLEEIYADSPETGVVRKIRPNSGLVRYEPRSDTPEWSQAVKDILASEKPSAIVVMLGLNDRVPMRDRTPPRAGTAREGEPPAPAANQNQPTPNPAAGQDAKPATQGEGEAAPPPGEQPSIAANEAHPAPGGTYEFHTDKWAELYTKRIDDMITALKSKGVPVLWVGLPSIRGPRSTSETSYLDELYRARAEKAGVVYVDIWDGFVDENGRYSVQGPDFEGQTRRLRSGDGVHFTKIGAVKLAHFVEHELSRAISSHVLPVALPVPATPEPAKPGFVRPAIGPVLPLAATGGGEGGDLLGAGRSPSPPPSDADPTTSRVLVRGDAIVAPAGRADDFSWPRRSMEIKEAPEVTPGPAAAAPPTPTVSAAPAAAPAPTVAKPAAAPVPSAAKPATPAKRSPAAGNDGRKPPSVPRPPMPIGPAASR
jgi:hypothetical protein